MILRHRGDPRLVTAIERDRCGVGGSHHIPRRQRCGGQGAEGGDGGGAEQLTTAQPRSTGTAHW